MGQVGRPRGSWSKFSPEVRREVFRLAARGWRTAPIARHIGGGSGAGGRAVLAPLGGGIRKEMVQVTGRRLSLDERVEIAVGLGQGRSLRAIAGGLGRCPSTVSREVTANGGI